MSDQDRQQKGEQEDNQQQQANPSIYPFRFEEQIPNQIYLNLSHSEDG